MTTTDDTATTAQRPGSGGGGGMQMPVQGVTPGDLSDNFGSPRSGGRSHKGIDIFADRGTPVRSAVSGTVEVAAPSGGLGGNRVWVQGDDGLAYYYAHLDSIDAQPGQRVTAGTQIGTVGNSGNAQSTPPHLHFSINRDRGPEDGTINPFDVLTEPGGLGDARDSTQTPSPSPDPSQPGGAQDPSQPPGGDDKDSTDDGLPPAREEIARYVRETYGHMAWAIDHPEIGPILRQAAEDDWSPARLRGAINQTDWWSRTADAQRQWQALEGEDPAEATRQINQRAEEVAGRLEDLGVPTSTSREGPDGSRLEVVRDNNDRVFLVDWGSETRYPITGSGQLRGAQQLHGEIRSESDDGEPVMLTGFTEGPNVRDLYGGAQGIEAVIDGQRPDPLMGGLSNEVEQIARDSLRFGWNEAELDDAIDGYISTRSRRDVMAEEGQMAAQVDAVRQMARQEFLTPITPERAFSHARDLITGEATQDSVRQSMFDAAESRFPDFAERIRAGETPRQVFDPYVQQAAELLEIPSGSIDPVDDPRFSAMTEFVDDSGERRAMTLSEWGRHLRSLPEYETTQRANEQASQMANTLLDVFSKRPI